MLGWITAAESNDVPTMSRLVAAGGVEINDSPPGRNTATALHYAARDGASDAVEWLLGKGASQAAVSQTGEPPLHWAVIGGHLTVVERLASHQNASLEAADRDGLTALHLAVINGRGHPRAKLALVRCLLAAGARADGAADNQGDTALHNACLRGSHSIAELLLRRGASPLRANDAGDTPLHTVARYGGAERRRIAALLLRWGADPEARRRRDERGGGGETAAQIADNAPHGVLADGDGIGMAAVHAAHAEAVGLLAARQLLAWGRCTLRDPRGATVDAAALPFDLQELLGLLARRRQSERLPQCALLRRWQDSAEL